MKIFAKYSVVLLLCTTVLCFISATVFAVNVQTQETVTTEPVSVIVTDFNGIEKISIKKNLIQFQSVSQKNNIYLNELEKHQAQSAEIQIEAFRHDETTNEIKRVNLSTKTGDVSKGWMSGDNDVYIVTAAYLLGYDSRNQAIYKAYGEVHATRNYMYHLEDYMAIKFGANAVYYSGYIDNTGSLNYHAREYGSGAPHVPGINIDEDRSIPLSPVYTEGNAGLAYKFTFPGDYNHSATGGGVSITSYGNYSNRYATGQYALIATNVSTIQVSYIHNTKIFGGSLSVNIGPVGVAIDVSGRNDFYAAEMLTFND